MRRRLLNLLSALSLLLCVAAVALWVRSYFLEDRLLWFSAEDVPGRLVVRRWQLTCVRGRVHWEALTVVLTHPANIAAARPALTGAPPVQHQSKPGAFTGGTASWSRHSFADSLWFDGGATGWKLILPPNDLERVWFAAGPLWLPALAAAAPPAWWAWRRRRSERRRRAVNRLCVRCGYDLRATPGCCPECGTAA